MLLRRRGPRGSASSCDADTAATDFATTAVSAAANIITVADSAAAANPDAARI